MSEGAGPLHKTPLHALHLALGARMAPFAGYDMPIQYPSGVLQEHLHTRAQAGLFDVSHMGQVRLRGAGADAALEALVPVDVIGLASGQQRYALFTNESGGILDDLMIARLDDEILIVVNAACKAQDIAYLERNLAGLCEVEPLPDRALIALQGPEASAALARLAPEAASMKFMQVARLDVGGADCVVSRSGYTGEDGYEISAPAALAEDLARRLLEQPEVKPIGLGARDSLRLEAGLCLYGHDIDTTTTPVEASLTWARQNARSRGRGDFRRCGKGRGGDWQGDERRPRANVRRAHGDGLSRDRTCGAGDEGVRGSARSPYPDGGVQDALHAATLLSRLTVEPSSKTSDGAFGQQGPGMLSRGQTSSLASQRSRCMRQTRMR